MLPLGPPDRYGSPYKASSAFAAWHGFLETPDAQVEPEEVEAFVARHAFWAPIAAGADAARTRCASSASGARCAPTRASAACGLIGDVPIYVAPGSL